MFTRGHKKVGGRIKGTPNKLVLKTQADLLTYIEQLEGQGVRANPLAILVDMMTTNRDDKIRLTCAIALADRLLPKLAAVKLSGDADEPVRTIYHVELWEQKLRTALARTEAVRQTNGHQPQEE
jgi:hypothetical protein